MKNELKKRIITSIILVILLFLMLKYAVVLISSLLIIFVLTWLEINHLLGKIFYNKKNFHIGKKILQLSIFFYLLFFLKIIIDDFIQNQPDVSWNLLYVITICILSDIGGFVFGKIFKGKKLTKISPNKTYSGMFGSFILTIIFSIIYSFSISFVDFRIIIFISILISLVCQIGDLLVSFVKRKSKVKDTGNILPGHGGILDRIDGILFALPFGLLLINYFY